MFDAGIEIFSGLAVIVDMDTAFGTGLVTGLEMTDPIKFDPDAIV